MIYTVYKVSCIINEKYYIGVHKTDNPNDSYLGSGKAIKLAIVKYGRENFKKCILATFDNSNEAYEYEKEIVSSVINDRYCYNIAHGGKDGRVKFINLNSLNVDIHKQRQLDPTLKKRAAAKGVAALKRLHGNKGTEWSKRTRLNLSEGMKTYYKTNKSVFCELNKSLDFQQKRKETFAKTGHGKGAKNSQYGTMWITKDGSNKKIKTIEYEKWFDIGWIKGRTCKSR